ncbi:MAG: ABC transporter ATP-binding protein [Dietzia psychralcaliphila]
MTVLEFSQVSRTFRDGAGVSELTVQITAGEIVALVGLNGAGKTTLMRLALGMLRPQQGTVRLCGSPLDAVTADGWARVGALIEVPLAYPELTVRRNLHIVSMLHGSDPRLVEDSLHTWKLAALADRRFRTLSLGNKRRVGLAAALHRDPRLIMLDEPSNALDPLSLILLREQLTRRAREGAAILVSSHHLDEVARIADRVLLMNAGRLIGELDTSGNDLERAFFDRILLDDRHRAAEEQAG